MFTRTVSRFFTRTARTPLRLRLVQAAQAYSSYPGDRKYTKSHEWIKFDGNSAVVGLSDHAQEALGDVVFLDLPQDGTTLEKGESFGAVESVKAASDIYMPVGGTITAINMTLAENPGLVNSSPHEDGWLIKMDLENPADAQDESLMNSEDYEKYCEAN